MVRTDADSDLTSSLDHYLMMLALARVDPRNGKWCVITAGSAAQTAHGHGSRSSGRLEALQAGGSRETPEVFDKLETDKDNEGDLRE